ncbi:MAG: hypothetical protein II424_02735, partial [Bacteroidales bacterium]|nr:hypothetical protein [Bacteroidales bacterium]
HAKIIIIRDIGPASADYSTIGQVIGHHGESSVAFQHDSRASQMVGDEVTSFGRREVGIAFERRGSPPEACRIRGC